MSEITNLIPFFTLYIIAFFAGLILGISITKENLNLVKAEREHLLALRKMDSDKLHELKALISELEGRVAFWQQQSTDENTKTYIKRFPVSLDEPDTNAK